MKLRVIDRLLVALSGLILLALTAWISLDAAGLVPRMSQVTEWLTSVGTVQKGLFVGGICLVLALLGIFDVSMLFRRRSGKRGFVTQRSENGEISISVKSIEGLVVKCAQKHGEVAVQSVTVEEARDGLLIKLRATLPSGMNIPLAVGTLQKQIKQYITACSGVDVREVRVKVDSTDQAAADSPYAVSDDLAALPVEQPVPTPTPAEAVAPVEMPVAEPEPAAEEREQLMHQRLFSTVEEPAMVPEPPVAEPEAAPEPDEEPEKAAEAEPAETTEESEPEETAVQEEPEAAEAAWSSSFTPEEAMELERMLYEPDAPVGAAEEAPGEPQDTNE